MMISRYSKQQAPFRPDELVARRHFWEKPWGATKLGATSQAKVDAYQNPHKSPAMGGISTVGKAKKLSEKDHLQFKIFDFAGLKHKRSQKVEPPSLEAHGQKWTIQLHPRGCSKSSKDNEYVSVYLRMLNYLEEWDATFEIQVGETRNLSERFCFSCATSLGLGWENFKRRDHILANDLDETGALVVDVFISVYKEVSPMLWCPPEPIKHLKSALAGMLESPTYSDITFMVADKEFCLHRCVLAETAPALCGLSSCSDQTITLADADQESFEMMVRFIYLGECPESFESAEAAKTLLLLANKYECVSLKLFVESMIVNTYVDESNAADLLLFAHANTCALLKEAAMKLCVEHLKTVRATKGWKAVTESKELLGELFLASQHRNLASVEIDLMTVAELRDSLLQKNKSIDGSREMLVNRLKECSTKFGIKSSYRYR